MTTKEEIAELFKSKGRTLGSVESLTGGLFASEITSMSGASEYFKGSIVTYATEIKENLLKIPHNLVEKFGVVSQECAMQMSVNGRNMLNVDYCIAFTGNAGPSAMEGKDVGTVYIAVCSVYFCVVYAYKFSGTREQIRNQCLNTGYEILKQEILKNN